MEPLLTVNLLRDNPSNRVIEIKGSRMETQWRDMNGASVDLSRLEAAEGSVQEDIPPTNISKSIAPSPLPHKLASEVE